MIDRQIRSLSRALTGSRVETTLMPTWPIASPCRALTGSRVETISHAVGGRVDVVEPSRARGLKRGGIVVRIAVGIVEPSRARGLKRGGRLFEMARHGRALTGSRVETAARQHEPRPEERRALTGSRVETLIGTTCRTTVAVEPSWARGLKHHVDAASRESGDVEPSRARGLKLHQRRRDLGRQGVEPLRARGLKLDQRLADVLDLRVEPSWARGLKLPGRHGQDVRELRRALTGSRVETYPLTTISARTGSSPHGLAG